MFNENFAQQGWQCPICGRVYSPTTPMCYYCGANSHTVTTTGGIPIPTPVDPSTTGGIPKPDYTITIGDTASVHDTSKNPNSGVTTAI